MKKVSSPSIVKWIDLLSFSEWKCRLLDDGNERMKEWSIVSLFC